MLILLLSCVHPALAQWPGHELVPFRFKRSHALSSPYRFGGSTDKRSPEIIKTGRMNAQRMNRSGQRFLASRRKHHGSQGLLLCKYESQAALYRALTGGFGLLASKLDRLLAEASPFSVAPAYAAEKKAALPEEVMSSLKRRLDKLPATEDECVELICPSSYAGMKRRSLLFNSPNALSSRF